MNRSVVSAKGFLPILPAKPRLLVAEDHSDLRTMLCDVLKPHYAVEAAADGELAWAAMQRWMPALLLTDLQMPNLDGLGLIRRIRSQPQLLNLPIVILTANRDKNLLLSALAAGADDFLLKPYSCAELLACLQVELAVPRFSRNYAAAYQSRLQTWEEDMRSSGPAFVGRDKGLSLS